MKKRKQSGIYRIYCTQTGKMYIGSSVDIALRWSQHRSQLRRDIHANTHLQHAWNKYGADSFVFSIIELVDHNLLLDREQHWINSTQCCNRDYGYNISVEAGRLVGDIEGRGRPAFAEKPQRVTVALDQPTIDILHKINPDNLSAAIRTLAAQSQD